MELKRVANAVGTIRADMIAVPIVAGGPAGRELGELDAASGGKLLREIRRRTSEPGKQGTVTVYQTHGDMRADLIAGIGIGRADAGRIEAEAWRRFAGQAIEAARGARAKSVAISVAAADAGAAATSALGAVIEGALLADYQIEGWKTSRATFRVETCIVAGVPATREAARVAKRAETLATSTRFARDLINGPAEHVTPDHLGRTAKRIGRENGLTVHVYGPEEMKRLKMGAILAVGRGSRNEPRLIELVYRPRRASGAGPVALVGKGITFDSGGLSLKPPASMEIQKRDMAGGAAVLGAMQAIGALKPDIEVRGYVASAENMPDGRAYRPGDVLRAFTGKTIEVLNTDAEGRLVLADALGWAAAGGFGRRVKPRWMVDLATLTGAVTTALGRSIAGVMGSDADLVRRLIEIGRETGEPMWELPLVDEYVSGMDSTIADLKNVGDGTAGTIYGGLFLREFTGGLPWAHLDIAAVAYADKARPYVPRGAVGWGVRTLVALVERAAREG
ncbi:leucyl aminopeptidase [Candidatus Binatia bacterium]|nr:leucyl aminopeptidase [Candidatus Binatia bacterium]